MQLKGFVNRPVFYIVLGSFKNTISYLDLLKVPCAVFAVLRRSDRKQLCRKNVRLFEAPVKQ